jgi:hypothetical protein
MTAQERADWEDARMAWGAFPPEPFRFAGRSFTGSAVLALRRAYGPDRLRNACLALDTLPYDDSLKAIANWCHEDDNVPC